jgi:hypothetical protein
MLGDGECIASRTPTLGTLAGAHHPGIPKAMIPQSLKFLLCALFVMLVLALAAIGIERVMRVAMEASGAIYNQYDEELGVR